MDRDLILSTNQTNELLNELLRDSQFLKTSEIAQAVGKPMRAISKIKKKNGISSPQPKPFKGTRQSPPKQYDTVDKSVWDNYTWLNFMYNEAGFGTELIARVANVNKRVIFFKYYKYKITPRKIKSYSRHPYCTKEWIDEKYNIEGRSCSECARLAGVNMYTMYSWLVKYGYEIRDIYEAQAGERSPWYGISRIPKKGHT